MQWECHKCGSEKLLVRQREHRTGIYCRECGAWIQWIDYRDAMRVYDTLKKKGIIPENAVYKRVGKFKGNMVVRCSECKCQLYHSGAPAPIGQFDLIDASYCPKCGKEFLF